MGRHRSRRLLSIHGEYLCFSHQGKNSAGVVCQPVECDDADVIHGSFGEA